MTLEENVEILFSQMASEEGKMIVISKIAGRIDLPERYFERAIRFYERTEDIKEVERLLAIERAIKLT